MNAAMSGTTIIATPATSSAAGLQPYRLTIIASIGRNTSWPVAVLAVRTPSTTPRRSTNHRLTTVAPSTIAVIPVPAPTTTPQSSTSCQGAVIRVVKATPAATTASDTRIVRRTPSRSISAAANGPISP